MSGTSGVTAAFEAGLAGAPDCMVYTIGARVSADATSTATALANIGPGLGEIIGPAGNFAPLSDAAKWILTLAMLVGRLELMVVLVLFTARFWRD